MPVLRSTTDSERNRPRRVPADQIMVSGTSPARELQRALSEIFAPQVVEVDDARVKLRILHLLGAGLGSWGLIAAAVMALRALLIG